MNPFISVVIPLYNKDKYIETTINSVLNQTFLDYEIIIVNDGSTDKSLNIVKNISHPRIRLYSNKNRGLSFSRNYGIRKAKANYVAFLDADDLWAEDFLETINKLISKYSNYYIFATNVDVLPPNKIPRLSPNPFDEDKIKIVLNYFSITKNILAPSSLVVKKSVFEKVGLFDETINYGEEYDFYIRCFSLFDLIYYQEPKIMYRTNVPDQLTAPNKNYKRRLPDYEKYLATHQNSNLKNFLDFIHFELVVLFKMERNYNLVNYYKQKIDTANLSFIKKVKYYLPTNLFYAIKTIYQWF